MNLIETIRWEELARILNSDKVQAVTAHAVGIWIPYASVAFKIVKRPYEDARTTVIVRRRPWESQSYEICSQGDNAPYSTRSGPWYTVLDIGIEHELAWADMIDKERLCMTTDDVCANPLVMSAVSGAKYVSASAFQWASDRILAGRDFDRRDVKRTPLEWEPSRWSPMENIRPMSVHCIARKE